MTSTVVLGAAGALALIAAAAHADYRASGQPGGVLSTAQANFVRISFAVLSLIAGCVGASLKVGGF